MKKLILVSLLLLGVSAPVFAVNSVLETGIKMHEMTGGELCQSDLPKILELPMSVHENVESGAVEN